MTENVLVTIKGLQFNTSDKDIIEVINIGHFSEINDKIYVKYDELSDSEKILTNNLIKIGKGSVEIIKKGPISTHMLFTVNEKTMAFYNTPFGSMYLSIIAKNVEIDKKEDAINIWIDYFLEINYEQISECKVEISIKPQDKAVKLI